jgi:hypothetical protein
LGEESAQEWKPDREPGGQGGNLEWGNQGAGVIEDGQVWEKGNQFLTFRVRRNWEVFVEGWKRQAAWTTVGEHAMEGGVTRGEEVWRFSPAVGEETKGLGGLPN